MSEREKQLPTRPARGPGGGHGPGGTDDARAKRPRISSGTMQRLLRLYRRSTRSRAGGGAALCRGEHRLLHRRAQDSGQGHHRALQRPGGQGARAPGGIDFGQIGTHSALCCWAFMWLSALLQLYTGMDHDRHFPENLPTACGKRSAEKINRMPMKYFESRTGGRGPLPHHQRRGHPGPEPQPERYPADHLRSPPFMGVLVMMLTISPLMTLIALVILPVSPGFRHGLVVKHSPEVLPGPAEVSGRRQRPGGGGLFGGHNVVKAFNR